MARPASRARINHNRALVERLDWPLIAEKLERFYVEVIAGRFRPTDTSARSR
jgi:hypothetical protein